MFVFAAICIIICFVLLFGALLREQDLKQMEKHSRSDLAELHRKSIIKGFVCLIIGICLYSWLTRSQLFFFDHSSIGLVVIVVSVIGIIRSSVKYIKYKKFTDQEYSAEKNALIEENKKDAKMAKEMKAGYKLGSFISRLLGF